MRIIRPASMSLRSGSWSLAMPPTTTFISILPSLIRRRARSGLPRSIPSSHSSPVRWSRHTNGRRTTTIPGSSKRRGSTSVISIGWRKRPAPLKNSTTRCWRCIRAGSIPGGRYGAPRAPPKPNPISTHTVAPTRIPMENNNKEIALRVLTGAFIDRDISVVERDFALEYVQHNPSLPNGRAAIPNLIAGLGQSFSYEPGMVVAERDLVMVHGRYVGWGPKPMVAVDIFRVANGRVVEHWDVMQEEVPASQTASGNPMFAPGR